MAALQPALSWDFYRVHESPAGGMSRTDLHDLPEVVAIHSLYMLLL